MLVYNRMYQKIERECECNHMHDHFQPSKHCKCFELKKNIMSLKPFIYYYYKTSIYLLWGNYGKLCKSPVDLFWHFKNNLLFI